VTGVEIAIRAVDQASKVIEQVGGTAADAAKNAGKAFETSGAAIQKSADQTTGALGKVKETATAMKPALKAIGTVVAGAMAFGVKATNELNQHMSRFQAETGASEEEVEKLKDTIQRTYKVNEDSYEDLTRAVTALRAQLGLTADQIDQDLQSYLDFAKVTGQDDAGAVEALDDILDAWSLDASNAAGIMDMLVASHQEYGGSITANQQALTRLAPAAQALGMSLEQTNGLLNLFADSGLDAAQAEQAFNYAARQFESPEEFKKAVQDLSAIENQTERTQASVQMFGSRAGVALANAFGAGKDGIDAFVVSMEDAQGVTAAASAQWDDNFNVKFALWRKKIAGTAQELTERFGPAVTAAGSAAMGMSSLFPGMGATITKAFAGMGTAAQSFYAVIVANPIIAILAAVAIAIAAAVYAWQNNLFGFRDKVLEIWEKIQATTTAVWERIKNFLVEWWPYLLGALGGPIGLLIAYIFDNWESIKAKTMEIWESIKSGVTSTVDNLKDATINKLEALWDYIKNIPSKAIQWGRDIFNALKEGFGRVKLPMPTFGISWSQGPLGISIPKLDIGVAWRALKDIVPWLAEGGIATGPVIAGLGEAGDEAIIPLKRLTPMIAEGVAAAGGGSPYIYIDMRYSSFMDGTDAGNKIARALEQRGHRLGY
jgi:hypothetical protein